MIFILAYAGIILKILGASKVIYIISGISIILIGILGAYFINKEQQI